MGDFDPEPVLELMRTDYSAFYGKFYAPDDWDEISKKEFRYFCTLKWVRNLFFMYISPECDGTWGNVFRLLDVERTVVNIDDRGHRHYRWYIRKTNMRRLCESILHSYATTVLPPWSTETNHLYMSNWRRGVRYMLLIWNKIHARRERKGLPNMCWSIIERIFEFLSLSPDWGVVKIT